MSGLSVELHRIAPGFEATLLRLSRGERRNALDLATVEALLSALQAAPEQPVMLGSTTPGIFCAGADLGVPNSERRELSDRLYECYAVMVERPGPVIAVIDGAAVGGGAQLCAAADLRIAGQAARWRWVGPRHGLAVGAWILPDLVGRSRALDLTLSGRWWELDEALRAGFLHRVADDPWAAGLALLKELAAAEPAALARVKKVATHEGLLEALHSERGQNRSSWDGHAPAPPTTKDSTLDS